MKKNTLKLFSFLIFTFSLSLGYGQQKLKSTGNVHQFGRQIQISTQERTPSGHIRCYTTENETILKNEYPQRQTTEEFENWLAPLVSQIEKNRAEGRDIQTVYNIPVVIHIVHNGDCLGTGENITDAQAISQVNVLNQDYRRMAGTPGGANSTGLATDIEINFILAKRDPSGNPTNGINRVQTTTASYNRAAVESQKASTIWDPTKYLNMWTFRFSGNLDGVLGYAQFPTGSTLTGIPAGTTTANTDGVVASYDAFGTIAEDDGSFILNSTYNLGRTMTHEVGHWLGLRHIWGDGNGDEEANSPDCSATDYCADTPAQGWEHYTCDIGSNTCLLQAGNDMVQNYMDYTNDACMDTFTPDQKTRMQTVMANSPRRSTLNASNGATAPSAGIYFNQGAEKCEVVEATNCTYTDVNYKVSIIKAPTANAVVTFAVNGTSTATNNVDFQIMTPTVTFATGSTADQILTIRYFNDGFVEPTETVNITMSLNANGGDGSIITSKSTLAVSIIDNDVASTPNFTTTVFSENFNGTTVAMSIKDLDGDGNNWGLGTSTNTIGFDTTFAFSRSWLSPSTGLNPDNILYSSTSFPMPNTNSNLSFYIGTTQGGSFYLEHYSVYLTTTNPSTLTATTLNAITPIINNAVLSAPASRQLINVAVPPSYNGQTLYIVIRHHNTFDMNWIMLDDILISSSVPTLVQTEVNTGTAYQSSVTSSGTFYATDNVTGNVIADGTTDSFNYGCTSVSVNRSILSAGSPAVNYGSNTANNMKVMAKTVTVTPTTNNPNGSVAFKFYFTEAEISEWESITGNNRSALKVFKGGETATYATTIGSFGTNVTLSATSPTGLAGVYYFGSDATLTNKNFDSLSTVSIYPNPASNELNINLSGDINTTIYSIYNTLGQSILTKKVGSQADLKVNTSGFSNGVYFIKIEREGNTKTLKFIKK